MIARGRFSVVVVVLLATIGLLAVPSVATGLPAGPGGGTSGPSKSGCIPLKLSSVSRAAPGGSWATAAGAATVYRFELAGSPVEQRIPPASWRPLTATAAELAFYGIPARPADPAARAAWTAEWHNYTGFAAPGICTRVGVKSNRASRPAGPFRAGISNDSSRNWSGMVANAHTFTKVYANIGQPTTHVGCVHDAHSTWVGLGGWYTNNRLLQNGTDDNGPLNKPYAWWEAIDPYFDTKEQVEYNLTVSPGASVNMSTTYTPGGNGSVSFAWHNNNTGKVATVGPLTSIAGAPTRYYYDGSSAEVIDERPTLSDGLLASLRNYSPTHWGNAKVWASNLSGAAIRNVEHFGVDMYDTQGTQLAHVYGSGLSSLEFIDYWNHCGVRS
jgi:hypothetical protein